MPNLYYATSRKSSAVTHSAVGAFAHPGALNLVLGLTSRLEVHTVTPEGLSPLCSAPLFGRIATLRLVVGAPARAAAGARGAQAQLVVTTERHQFMVLEWDAAAASLRTVACGDMRVRVVGGRASIPPAAPPPLSPSPPHAHTSPCTPARALRHHAPPGARAPLPV